MEAAKIAQKAWARTPLWKRAELLHKAAAILKEHKAPIAECLVKEIAKPAKDAVSEVNSGWNSSLCFALTLQLRMLTSKKMSCWVQQVVRSGDLVSYTAEEGVRILGEGKLLVSDSFPGNERNKYCLSSKV
jgi:glyceraldehyde-3-phosphate dehydrogenase (NADP+)